MSLEALAFTRRIPYWLWPWCVLLFLMPLKELVPGPVIMALEVGGGLLLALSPRRGASIARAPFVAVAALTIWLSLTYLWSIAPAAMFDPFVHITAAFLAYALATSAALRDEELTLALRFWIWGGICCGLALFAALLAGQAENGRAYLMIGAYASNPNTITTELLIPFALACGAVARKGRRVEGVLGIVAAILGVMATESRGGALAMLIVLLAQLALRRRFVTIVALVAVIAGLYAGFASDLGRFNLADDPTGSHRTAIWAAIWPTALANWPTGVGLGATTAVTGSAAGYYKPMNAHNTYLQSLLEAGLPGLLLLLLVVGLHLNERGRHAELRSLRAGLLGIAVAALFDHVLSYPLLWIPWVAIAQATGTTDAPAHEATAEVPVRAPKRPPRPTRRMLARHARPVSEAPPKPPLSHAWQRLTASGPDLTGDAS